MSDKKLDVRSPGAWGMEVFQEREITARNTEEESVRSMKDTAEASSSASVGGDERDKLDLDTWNLDAEHQALLDSFDGRLTEAHRRMDRVLARLNVE